MKKTLTIIAIFMLVLVSYTVVANAATPVERIMDYASETISINGQPYALSNGDILRIQKYFNQYPVTDDSVADQIIAKGKQIRDILATAGVADPLKLPTAKRQEVLSIAQSAAALAEASISYDSSTKTATIYNGDTEFDRINMKEPQLVQTGSNNVPYICVAVVAVIAIATITIVKVRKSKVNA